MPLPQDVQSRRGAGGVLVSAEEFLDWLRMSPTTPTFCRAHDAVAEVRCLTSRPRRLRKAHQPKFCSNGGYAEAYGVTLTT